MENNSDNKDSDENQKEKTEENEVKENEENSNNVEIKIENKNEEKSQNELNEKINEEIKNKIEIEEIPGKGKNENSIIISKTIEKEKEEDSTIDEKNEENLEQLKIEENNKNEENTIFENNKKEEELNGGSSDQEKKEEIEIKEIKLEEEILNDEEEIKKQEGQINQNEKENEKINEEKKILNINTIDNNDIKNEENENNNIKQKSGQETILTNNIDLEKKIDGQNVNESDNEKMIVKDNLNEDTKEQIISNNNFVKEEKNIILKEVLDEEKIKENNKEKEDKKEEKIKENNKEKEGDKKEEKEDAIKIEKIEENNKESKEGGKTEKKEDDKKEEKEGDKNEDKKDIKMDQNKENRQEEKKDNKNNIKEEKDKNKSKDNKENNNDKNKINKKEKKIPEGFTNEDEEKIKEFINSNYKKFFSKNHFCDYLSGKEWRAGFILNIEDNYLKIIDATNKSSKRDSFPLVKVKIDDSKNVSYFRKFSKSDDYMVKGTEKNLNNKLNQFINFHNNFKEYFEYCDSYEFYYFLKATVYYGLDFCMNPNIIKKNNSKDNIEISFRLILIILNIICDCLKFIEENIEDFLKYQNEIKNSENQDYILISKKYAIYSFFDDIHYLIKKIFGDSIQYLDWYITYKDDINGFIPSINDTPKIQSISELFPLYKDQKGGNNKYKLMKKICLPQVYNRMHIFHTLDKNISSCIMAYIVDYFNFIGGYDTLFTLLCSIYHNKDNYKENFKTQLYIIQDLYTSKIITGSFSNHEGIKKINKYIDEYADKFDEEIVIYQNELDNFFLKLISLIQQKDEDGTLLSERIKVIYLFKKLAKTKKLERNINLIGNLNNIIKSVQYNNLYKEIREKNDTDKNEEMLNDAQFQGRDKNIKEMTEEYFCKLCQENKIIELFLDNKTTHEEIIKRIYPLLFIMNKNNYGYEPNSEKRIDSKYVFDSLFQKLKESEQNNESLWKIILSDIILEFAESLDLKDKNYVFQLIKKYFEETSTKKNSKIIQLISFVINYSLKCINSSGNLQKENDLILEKIIYNDSYNQLIYCQLNESKFYGLELLINQLIDKNKINSFEVNSELKMAVINTCIDGIIDILKIFHENEKDNDIIKIIFMKIINAISLSINISNNIDLIEKIFKLGLKKNIKEEFDLFFKEKKYINKIFDELFNYIKNVKKENEKEEKKEIEKRLDLIFLLLENDIRISNEDFTNLFIELTKINEISKKIFYMKMKENILKINIELREYIFRNILLNKEFNFEINDFMSYQLLKEFILQINKSKGKFIFITERDMIVIPNKEYSDIYGQDSLWDILLKTTNKDIRNDVCNFLSEIFLATKYKYLEEYKKLWNLIIKKIITCLKTATKGNNINNNSIKGLINLIKKINENSNKDGEIFYRKDIIDNLIEPYRNKIEEKKEAKDKENSDLKVEGKKTTKKEGKKEEKKERKKEELNKEKNEDNSIKIKLEYFEDNNEDSSISSKKSTKMFDIPSGNENKVRKTRICEIYLGEFFYILRYLISYEFKIPLKCIQFKKNMQNKENNNNADKKGISQDKKNNNLSNKKTIIKSPEFNLLLDYINIFEVFQELKQNIKKKNKKENEDNLPLFTVEKINNPLSDKNSDNLKNLIAKNEELMNILKELSKNKNNDYALDIWSIINDKKEVNKDKEKETNRIIEDLIKNSENKSEDKNDQLLNQLFNFDESNIFYMNYNLSQIYNYMNKQDEKTKKDIVHKFINCSIWQKKIKNLSIEINNNDKENNNKSNLSINELYEAKRFESNLLNIYKLILNNISYDKQKFDFIIKNIIQIYFNIIQNCLNIDLETANKQNKEDKETFIKIKKIYKNIFTEINDLFFKNKKAFLTLIKLMINEEKKENDIKDNFEFCFIDGIIKNNCQYLIENIFELLLILINSEFLKEKNDEIKKIQKDFYLYICSIFFTKKNHEKIIQLLATLFDNSNIFVILYTQKYEYNLKFYLNKEAEILSVVYNIVCNEFDFESYILEIVIPFIYEPLLKDIKNESNFHDYLFGGYCSILSNYIIAIDNEKYKIIQNYKGKDLKKYLFDEIIMYMCNEDSTSFNEISLNEKTIKIKNSKNEASHLFISIFIKEMNSNDPQIQNSIKHYLDKINNFNKVIYRKKEGEKEKGKDKENGKINYWKLYYKEQDISNAFIGLKNLGCTCYMNSLLQVFYHIELFRESLLKCDCKEEKKNSLYEVQKVFLFLKYMKGGYYTPDTIVDNFDNEKLNVHQQMDADEFFSNIIDKLENRLKNTNNENLLKYFFLGRLNDTFTFQEGCNHHRTNVNDFYSIQLQVQNKKNIYESLDTLTEGELMNGDNCIFCPNCNKKFPALKRQCFRVLPRMLMFVLKRFEFNFDTMTKFKVNDHYEFPIELDMNKYTSDYIDNANTQQNNKYTLKSVVVHMGSSEGGHYYAYIKDNKSKVWYQFNDTSVTKFNISDLADETFGGKEENSKTEKNRSAYLLFYEKIDQSNCETFDKNYALNQLLNKKEINNNENKENDDKNGFSLFGETENEKENNSNDNKNQINEISKDKNENKSLAMKEMIKNINKQMLNDYLNQKIFSNEYHHFTLELFLNILNIIDFNNNTLPIFFENLCYINNDNHFENEATLCRNARPKGSNLTKYINKGKLKIFNLNKDDNKYSEQEKEKKVINLFEYILIEFFNIIIRSRERKYLGCYANLIQFLINNYEYCANYFLEELSCYNTIIEYLINCPLYEIKKLIVGIIYCAMIKSNEKYASKKDDKVNNKSILNEKTKNEQKSSEILSKDLEVKNSKEVKNKNKNKKDEKENTEHSSDKNKLSQNKSKIFGSFEIIEKEKDIIAQTEQIGPITGHYLDEINFMRNKENKDQQMKENKNSIQNEEDKKKKTEKELIDQDAELAKKLYEEELKGHGNYSNNNIINKEKEGNNNILENQSISPNVLKLIYNVTHTLTKIKILKFPTEVRFLIAIILKFSFLSSKAKELLIENLKLCNIINVLNFQRGYFSERDFDIIDMGLFKTSHEILNPSPNKVIFGEPDKIGKYINVNYDFMLLCSLMSYKEKPKEELEKNNENLIFTFWNKKYIIELIRTAKTKQDINYLSNLIKVKCSANKEIFDIVLNVLLIILDELNDIEKTFFDEYDQENSYNIYKNKNTNSNSKNNLRSNATIIIKKLILDAKDKFDDYRIKNFINKIFSLFNKYKKYYGISILLINILIDIYDERNDIYKKYPKEINEILNWLNKYKIPPKLYEIKGIKMYKDEDINYYYQSDISKDVRKEFDQVEIEKTNKKIEKINKIIKGKNVYDISNFDGDLSDFKFAIGDQVMYDNKLYKVTNCLEELIKVKLIENKNEEENDKEFKVKNLNKKNMDIYDKEKISFWIETDDYRLKIKKLIKTNLKNK